MATPIPSGTTTLFRQTTAQPGWVKLTNIDDFTLRVVNGTASTGGLSGFSTLFPSSASRTFSGTYALNATIGGVTLTTTQIASHTHQAGSTYTSAIRGAPAPGGQLIAGPPVDTTLVTSGSGGGGGSHTHPTTFTPGTGPFTSSATIDFRVQYVDCIRATRS